MMHAVKRDWISTGVALVILAFHLSFKSYQLAFDSEKKDILTSLIVAGGATILEVLVATPAAYALARFRLPSHRRHRVAASRCLVADRSAIHRLGCHRRRGEMASW
jgi:ABC-type glycerol-3-phosphate transport system permease component